MSVREKSYARRSGGRGAGGRSLAVNAAFFVLILLFGILYFSSKYWAERGMQNALKACASILFVCCSLYNLLTGGCRSAGCCRLLFAGQVFACAGDIGLNYDFVVGAALFAMGHILFFAAFCALEAPTFRSAAAIGVIAAASFCLLALYDGFDFRGFDLVVCVYAAVISCMLGKAVSIGLSPLLDRRVRVPVLLGAALFYFSDLMLVFHQFGNGGAVFDALCLGTYYPAEFLLAFSVFTISAFGFGKGEKPVSDMNIFARMYCRTFQAVFRFCPIARPNSCTPRAKRRRSFKRRGRTGCCS